MCFRCGLWIQRIMPRPLNTTVGLLVLLTVAFIDTSLATVLSAQRTENELVEDMSVLGEFQRHYSTKEVDLVFVLDRSSSVPVSGWASMVNFVRSLLGHFTVDGSNTRVAVISYSTTASVDVNDLGSATENKCSLMGRLNQRLSRKVMSGYTATYQALYTAGRLLYRSRTEAKKAVFVLTDGESNIGYPPVRASLELRSLQWNTTWNSSRFGPQLEIYAFGIKDAYMPELTSVAPAPNHTYYIPDFRMFRDLARSLHFDKQGEVWQVLVNSQRCDGRCSPNAMCTCGTRSGQYLCVCKQGYQGNGVTCTECPRGTFKDVIVPGKCQRCPVNTTTVSTGAHDVTLCSCQPPYHMGSDKQGCLLKYCEVLPDITHGHKFHVEGAVTDERPDRGQLCVNSAGDSCHYRCDQGYRLTGHPGLVCQSNGSWTGNIPKCNIIDCHTLQYHGEVVSHGTTYYLNDSTTYGSVVNVTCDIGWRQFGDRQRTCTQHGIWSGTQTWCIEARCPSLPPLIGGEITPQMCSQTQQKPGQICTYSCHTGFVLHGPSSQLCDYHGNWNNHTSTRCEDVQPPTISCPSNITTTITSGNYSLIYWDAERPEVGDNSGNHKVRVIGAPNENPHRFHFGFHQLRYEARDAAGNEASCLRQITVVTSMVRVQFCPSDILVTDVSNYEQEVSWPSPVFLDHRNQTVAVYCSRQSGSLFSVGTHHIHCYPSNRRSSTSCNFSVELKRKDCFTPPPPLHGGLTCGTGEELLKLCTVHCNKNYDFHLPPQYIYKCDLDATWNLRSPGKFWPDCSRKHYPGRAMMQGHFRFHYYTGLCEEMKEELSQQFILKIQAHAWNICGSVTCQFSDVKVHCGVDLRRLKRQIPNLPGGPASRRGSQGSGRRLIPVTPKPHPGMVRGPVLDRGEESIAISGSKSSEFYSGEISSNSDSSQVTQAAINEYILASSITNSFSDIVVSPFITSPSHPMVTGFDVLSLPITMETTILTISPSSVSVIQSTEPIKLWQYSDSLLSTIDSKPPDLMPDTILENPSDEELSTQREKSLNLESSTCIDQWQNQEPSTDFKLISNLQPGTTTGQYSDLPSSIKLEQLLGIQPSVPSLETRFTIDSGLYTESSEVHSREHTSSSPDNLGILPKVSSLVKETLTLEAVTMENVAMETSTGQIEFEAHKSRGVTKVMTSKIMPSSSILFSSFPDSKTSEFSSQLGEFDQLSRSSITVPLSGATPIVDFKQTFPQVTSTILSVTGTGNEDHNLWTGVRHSDDNTSQSHTWTEGVSSAAPRHNPSNGTDSHNEYLQSFTRSLLLLSTVVSQQERASDTSLQHMAGVSSQGYVGETITPLSLSSATVAGESLPEGHQLVITFQVRAESSVGDMDGQISAEDALIFVSYDLPEELIQNNFSLGINESFFDFKHDVHSIRFGEPDIDCPNGYIKQRNYPMSCVACPRGTYHVSVNETCELCPLGQYQDDEGQESCLPCPNATTTLAGGAKNETECRASCGSGHRSPSGLEPCTPCDIGYYQSNVGMTECVPCLENETTTRVGAERMSQCGVLCQSGFYNLDNPCLLCSASYHPGGNETDCLPTNCDTETENCTDFCFNLTQGPCENGGSCIQKESGFHCVCLAGFTGKQCQIQLNYCEFNSCHNNATCVEMGDNYRCNCMEGYTGQQCDIDIDECSYSPCQHGSSCLDLLADYQCYCNHGYHGRDCQYFSECSSNPCLHGDCEDLEHGYMCNCHRGFTGRDCSDADHCLSTPCGNGGTCVPDSHSREGYLCICLQDWTGKDCEVAVREACDTEYCSGQGQCVSLEDDYACRCHGGFGGNRCQLEISNTFDLVFLSGSLMDYVSMPVSEDLSTVTISLWMQTNDFTNQGTIFSYIVSGSLVFSLMDYSGLEVHVGNHVTETGIPLNDGWWHHLCLAVGDNKWDLYINGTLAESRPVTMETISTEGGTFIIGQSQDLSTESLVENTWKAYIGEISQLNVFSSLNRSEISQLASQSSCDTKHGDVIPWTSVIGWLIGHVTVRNESHCLDTNECLTSGSYVCGENRQCRDLIGSFECGECIYGYTGEQCMQAVNECDQQVCQNEASCQDGPLPYDYQCLCRENYTGRNCEDEIEGCLSQPCKSGQECITVPDAVPKSLECEELDVYTGDTHHRKCSRSHFYTHCFASWEIKDGQVRVLAKGCSSNLPSCRGKEECVGDYEKGAWFCCCDRSMCNVNISSSREVPSEKMAMDITLYLILGLVCVILGFAAILIWFIIRLRRPMYRKATKLLPHTLNNSNDVVLNTINNPVFSSEDDNVYAELDVDPYYKSAKSEAKDLRNSSQYSSKRSNKDCNIERAAARKNSDLSISTLNSSVKGVSIDDYMTPLSMKNDSTLMEGRRKDTKELLPTRKLSKKTMEELKFEKYKLPRQAQTNLDTSNKPFYMNVNQETTGADPASSPGYITMTEKADKTQPCVEYLEVLPPLPEDLLSLKSRPVNHMYEGDISTRGLPPVPKPRH